MRAVEARAARAHSRTNAVSPPVCEMPSATVNKARTVSTPVLEKPAAPSLVVMMPAACFFVGGCVSGAAQKPRGCLRTHARAKRNHHEDGGHESKDEVGADEVEAHDDEALFF